MLIWMIYVVSRYLGRFIFSPTAVWRKTEALKKDKIFYGWYIVAAGILLMVCNSGIMMFGFAAFITPIAVTTGWSYAQISLASSLHGLESGALSPFLGAAVDRWPAKSERSSNQLSPQ